MLAREVSSTNIAAMVLTGFFNPVVYTQLKVHFILHQKSIRRNVYKFITRFRNVSLFMNISVNETISINLDTLLHRSEHY